MRRIIFYFALPLFACEDEPKVDPVEPDITQALVECRPVDGIYTLSVVDFTVVDLDGVEDLVDEPLVLVEATRLRPVRKELDAMVEGCRTEACSVNYRWEYQRGETEQIFCGDAARLILSAKLDVQDSRGLVSRKLVGATAL